MGQQFVGSNNINLIFPSGNYGSRYQGGSDHGSSRYIFARLEKLTPLIFRKEDNYILEYNYDDGKQIEPIIYSCIIPLILVNGSCGIATGYSTNIPCFNPLDIINNLKRLINNESCLEMAPWYRGYHGKIEKDKDDKNKWNIYGTYEIINEDTVKVSELPIGRWYLDYKYILKKMTVNGEEKKEKEKGRKKGKEKKERKERTPKNKIISYWDGNMGSDENICLKISFEPGELQKLLKKDDYAIYKTLKLITSIKTTNMNLTNNNGVIAKYNCVEDIMIDFYNYRLKMYVKRKEYMIKLLKNQMLISKYKKKFIEYVLSDEKTHKPKIIMDRMKKIQIIQQLEKFQFPKLSVNVNADDSEKDYSYTEMSIYNRTEEKIKELTEDYIEKQKQLDYYEKIAPSELWLIELNEFENGYNKWLNELSNDEQKKPKRKSKTSR